MKSDRPALIALLLVCFFWGTTYLAMRVGVTTCPPFLFSGIRMLAASVILGIYLFINRPAVKITLRMIGLNSLAGILFFCLGVGMVGWAEKQVPSGLAALICSLPPVWLVLINVFVYRIEKLNAMIVVGVLLGLGGMVLVFHEHVLDLLRPEYRKAVGVTVLGNFSWVIATLIVKKGKPSDFPIFNSCLQMLSGGLALMLLHIAFEGGQSVLWTREVVIALVYLVIFGSVVAFAAYSYALAKLPVTLVSLHTYANVFVAIAFGAIILHEQLNAAIGIAVLVSMAGIYLVNRGLKINRIREQVQESLLLNTSVEN